MMDKLGKNLSRDLETGFEIIIFSLVSATSHETSGIHYKFSPTN
jgi:hypothetical protein